MELKKQVTQGVFWVFTEQLGSQLVGFVINLVLARLLLPADFGTIALYGIVMSIATVLMSGGLGPSLIRHKEVDNTDFSTVFWFNVSASILLYLLIFFLAPLLADFYQLDIITSLLRVSALILIIDSFASVQVSRMLRQMDFKKAFKIQLPSLLLGGAAGIYFALKGYGVWSLVYAALIQNSLYTLQYWLYSDWRPSFVFDRIKFKLHFGFGSRMTLSALLDVIFNNLYTIIIGKLFSTTQLGYYNRADSLKQLPINNIAGALNKVTFPLFSKIQDDNERLRRVYKELLAVVIFLIAPVVALMIVSAEPLIRLLLTEKWMPAVPYFKVLALSGLLYPIHAYNLNILQAKGRSDLFLRLELIKKACIVLVIICTLQFGVMGLVWGQVILSVIALFINTHYTGRFLHYPLMAQLRDLFPSIAKALLLGVLCGFFDFYYLSAFSDFIRLSILVFTYLLIYFAVAYFGKAKEISSIYTLLLKR